jgi:hypothetical protein
MNRIVRQADISLARGFVNASFANATWRSNGHGRRFAMFQTAPGWGEAFSLFGLAPVKVEPMFGCFIGHHYLEGAHTHEHQDSNDGDLIHTRVNVMLKKPDAGGDPVLSGNVMHIEEGDVWLCLAGLEPHASTPITKGERIILSFGGMVPHKQLSAYIMKKSH